MLDHPTGFAEMWFGTVEVTGIENAVITGARIAGRRTPSCGPER